MQIARASCRAPFGVDAVPVLVETHLAGGLPSISIVGLPETAVRESKDRVRSALQTAGFEFPAGRVTINLAPADLPKRGGRYDLAIALGILAASGQVPDAALDGGEFIAELSLGGELRPVSALLPAAMAATAAGKALFVAPGNAHEAALVPGARVFAAGTLVELCAHLRGEAPLHAAANTGLDDVAASHALPDLADVRGQPQARRALEVAAAGGHSLLLIGPPGTGKSMLAARLPGLLPALTDAQALEVAAIHSLRSQGEPARPSRRPPWRAPHHSSSARALVGGGNVPRPGELSLAHQGVLFLDELPEFDRQVLDMLREPLETGSVLVSRALQQCRFPARVQLVAAMNPCPCGWLGDPQRSCGYTCERATRYRTRVSGPLLDRIDLHVEVPPLPPGELASAQAGEDSATVRARVARARTRQLARGGVANNALQGVALREAVQLSADDTDFLVAALARLRLSARAAERIQRVARTIADLADAPSVTRLHLLEALAYRCLDRQA